MKRLVVGLALLLPLAAVVVAKPAPVPIDELRAGVERSELVFENWLPKGKAFFVYVMSYRSAGLKVQATVSVPKSGRPENGFPVLVANHGLHPDPPRYGFTAAGVNYRPGDYYRPIPELYAANGFIVVMPDYRGHNDSEGGEYTKGFLASAYYTEDVLALLAALEDLQDVDLDNVFMWGHSLGGEVSLRALLATDRIKGASLWSTVGGEIWDQAYYYSRRRDLVEPDSSAVAKASVDALRADIDALSERYDWRSTEPLHHLDMLTTPLILHHAVGDTGARYEWSERLARQLYLLERPYVFHSYAGTAHYFDGRDRELAVERDVAFFRSLMTGVDDDTSGTRNE